MHAHTKGHTPRRNRADRTASPDRHHDHAAWERQVFLDPRAREKARRNHPWPLRPALLLALLLGLGAMGGVAAEPLAPADTPSLGDEAEAGWLDWLKELLGADSSEDGAAATQGSEHDIDPDEGDPNY
ncbi:MAG: hypothetical protein KatS3mg126_2506 [Lysobacteraceae bacterium]|nr:MAG: hypothetical protein KatS3mg126_2506 [Xanthomonadaceae bacterium]